MIEIQSFLLFYFFYKKSENRNNYNVTCGDEACFFSSAVRKSIREFFNGTYVFFIRKVLPL